MNTTTRTAQERAFVVHMGVAYKPNTGLYRAECRCGFLGFPTSSVSQAYSDASHHDRACPDAHGRSAA